VLISGRYRLGIKPGQRTETIDNKYRDRYAFNAGYKLYDGKDSNYENNLTASYKVRGYSSE